MRLSLTVNGEPREAEAIWEGESLMYVLRERLGLPGAKNACEQGECGSCSVLLDGLLVCSCLVLARQAEGREVATVEGLAPPGGLGPVQQAFVDTGAVQCGFCTPGLVMATEDLLRAQPLAGRRRDPRGPGGQPLPLHRLREDPRRRPPGLGPERAVSGALLVSGCAVATMDDAGTEHGEGWILVEDGRIAALGGGDPPGRARRAPPRGRAATWPRRAWSTATTTSRSGPPAASPRRRTCSAGSRRSTRSGPASTRRSTHAAALAALARPRRLRLLARAPTTTTSSRRGRGDLLGASIRAAREAGPALPPLPRLHGPGALAGQACRPTRWWRTATRSSRRPRRPSTAGTTRRRARCCASPWRPARRSRSPASSCATSAELARRRGVRLHTHLAETLEEEEFCLERFGVRPVEYLDELGWLGPDVWLAHCVHLSPPGDRPASRPPGTAVAHCPSSNARLGAGIAPAADLARGRGRGRPRRGRRRLQRGGRAGGRAAPGAAGGALRAAGAAAMTVRGALALGTIGAARAASAARTRSARWSRASSPTSPSGASTAPGHAGIADPVVAWSWAAARRTLRQRRPVVGPAGPAADLGEIARRASRDGAGAREHDPHRLDAAGGSARASPRADGAPKVRGEFAYASDLCRRRDALGRHAAEPAPERAHPRDRDRRGARGARRAGGAHARGRARAGRVRHGDRRPAGARDRRGALPGRAGGDRRRRPPRDGPPGRGAHRGRLRCPSRRSRAPTPPSPTARRPCTRAATCCGGVRIRHGEPDRRGRGRGAGRRTRWACRTRPSSARSRRSACPPRTAASTSTSPPSGSTLTRARWRPAWGCRPS